MELNRNQYFFAGLLIVLLGFQLRMVESFELTPEATKMLAKPAAVAQGEESSQFTLVSTAGALPGSRRVVQPPEWLGWCLISVGSVLILHSLAMKKPD